MVRQALADRTRGNTSGVHFYDEPGLTWMKDAKGETTPHGVPAQVRSFEAPIRPIGSICSFSTPLVKSVS